MSNISWRPGKHYRLRGGKTAVYQGICQITGKHRATHACRHSGVPVDKDEYTTVLYTDDGRCSNRPDVDSPWDIVGEVA